MPHILIVDDEKEIAELIGLYLRKEGYEFSIAGNEKEAMEILQTKSPHLILLDVLLPDIDGIELCQKIRWVTSSPIIFISCKDTEMDKIIGLSVGGDDYVSKPFSFNELVARIKAHIRRSRILIEDSTEPVKTDFKKMSSSSVSINLDSYDVILRDKKIDLSTKEFQILKLLMLHPKKVLSTEQLLQNVWGYECDLDTKTVTVHIGNLRRKIESNPNKPQLIITIRGVGYKFNEDVKNS